MVRNQYYEKYLQAFQKGYQVCFADSLRVAVRHQHLRGKVHLLLYPQCHTYPNDPQLPKDKNIPKLSGIVFQSSPPTTHRLLLLFIPILDVADVSRHPVLLADNLLA